MVAVEQAEPTKYVQDSQKLVDYPTELKFIGERTTICQVIQLLAYIRNAIKNNRRQDIKVTIGKNIENGKFLFDVNGQEIPDLKAQPTLEIN